MFYGRAKQSVIGDFSLMLYESLLGFVPMVLLRGFIKYRLPTKAEIEIYNSKKSKEFETETNQKIMKQLSHIQVVRSRSPSGSMEGAPVDIQSLKDDEYENQGINSYDTDNGKVFKFDQERQRDGSVTSMTSVTSPTFGSRPTTPKLTKLPTKKLIHHLQNDIRVDNFGLQLDHDLNESEGTIVSTGRDNININGGDHDTGNYNHCNHSERKNVSNMDMPPRTSGYGINVNVDIERMELIEEVRQRLIRRRFRYPSYCKYLTYIFIIIWSILCAFVTTLYCLWFDYEIRVKYNEYREDIMSNCTDGYNYNYDIDLESVLNYNATQTVIDNINGTLSNDYQPPVDDSFGEGLRVSVRFLISVALSYILGVFVWQPLVLLLRSYCKLRLYRKNPNYLTEANLFFNEKYLIQSIAGEKKDNNNDINTNGDSSKRVDLNIVNNKLLIELDIIENTNGKDGNGEIEIVE